MTKTFKKHRLLAFLLLLPQIVITLVFFFWPAYQALIDSFFYGDAFGRIHRFAGIRNYIDLFRSNLYLKSLVISFLFSLLVTAFVMIIGLVVALLVHKAKKGKSIFKTSFVWPYAVAPAVSAMLWRFVFDPSVGWGTLAFNALGVDWNYLVHPKQALLLIVLASSWQQFSYNFLFYFASIMSIPESLLEAAYLDGASGWQVFKDIILPLLAPVSFYLLVVNIIYAFFDTFGVISVITQGGPGRATQTLVYKVYTDGFIGMNFSSSAAQSVLLMFIVMLLTLVQFKYLDKRVHYQ